MDPPGRVVFPQASPSGKPSALRDVRFVYYKIIYREAKLIH